MLRIHLITLFFAQLKLTPLVSVRYTNICISPKRTESMAFDDELSFDNFFSQTSSPFFTTPPKLSEGVKPILKIMHPVNIELCFIVRLM